MTFNVLYIIKVIIISFIIAFVINSVCNAKSTSSALPPPWKKWKQFNNISVSSRVSAVNELTEIKATALVNSSLSGFLLFIQDVNNTPEWLTNASSSEIVKQLSTTEHIFTVNFSAIWPVKTRYLQLHSHYWQNNNLSVEIQLKDDFSVVLDNSDAIRIKFYQGHWLITPILNNDQHNQLIIEYSFVADSGGDIPKWIADQLALKSILKSMKQISLQLPQSKWQQQTIPNITELAL